MHECPNCGFNIQEDNIEKCPNCSFNFNYLLGCPYKISNKCVHT